MNKNPGFTLLECIIALSLSALLFFSVAMAYRTLIHRHQLSALVDQLTDAIIYAHAMAIASHATVTICPDGNNTHCGTDWQRGQLIVDEKNHHVFRVLPPIPKTYHLCWRSTLGDVARLRFRADGFTRGQQGSFYFCARSKTLTSSAKIILLRTGRLRILIEKMRCCDQMT